MITKSDYFEPAWYLAQFKPNCAIIAKRNLTRQGFHAFLPLETQTRTAQGKFIEEIKPLFPGYLFVRTTDKSGPVQSVHSTYGVSQLVRFGTSAVKVPTQLVEELKSRCNGDEVIRPNGTFKKGEKVRVTNGPFIDLVGEVERTTPNRRVWLLLNVIGQKTKVSVDPSALQVKA